MGWTYLSRDKGQSNLKFFSHLFPSIQIVEIATVKGVCYIACQSRGVCDGEVFALVILTRWDTHDKYGSTFGYKDMAECSLPYYFDCPAKVLDALTPTDNADALEWRAKCRERLAKPVPKIGQTIRLDKPIWAGKVADETVFTKVKYPGHRDVYRAESGGLIRLTRLRDYDYQIIA